MQLKDKVALVTGGARIGAVVAEELARRGCHVALSYRNSRASAVDTSRKIERWGRRALVLKADLTKEKDVIRTIRQIRKTFGKLHVLVNMASRYVKTSWERLSENEWQASLNADAKSAYLTTLHAAPLLRSEGGRVINFSDWLSASGRPRTKQFLTYYVAKSAVLGLTQALALELAPRILVNAIGPGPILAPPGLSRQENENVKRATPLGRWGGPQEIAKAVIFLSETDFVTGECLRVDGGRHLY